MTWAKGRGYAMLDVNVLERPNPKQKVRRLNQMHIRLSYPFISS